MKNKLLDYLLNDLEKVITVTEDIIFPYKGFDPRKIYRRPEHYRRSLKNLEQKGLLKKSKDRFYLTLKGKLTLLQNQRRTKLKAELWDKKWRILTFDIPETKRQSRRELRKYLYSLGFKPIQQSTWITPYKINYKDLYPLFSEKIKEKLLFIETDTISEEKKLLELFDL